MIKKLTELCTGCGLRTSFGLIFTLGEKNIRLKIPHFVSFIQPLMAAVTVISAIFITCEVAADVKFPDEYNQGKHYASIVRGDTREELFTTPEAIAAARRGDPFPEGTVITMEDYRDNKLYRYVVMEKRKDWGKSHSSESPAGDWGFQWFNPDRSVKSGENLDRCRACHTSQSDNDYVFSFEKMKEEN